MQENKNLTPEESAELEISAFPTPNPNALKFVLNLFVKNEGKSTYRSVDECGENLMAHALFSVRGVDSLHFFQNTITITKFGYQEWESLEEEVIKIIEEQFPNHNPNYHDPDPEAERRKKLTPELLQIEEILDHTIRPGLQGDGGDLSCLEFRDDVLLVRYHGACGTCPSSTTGTLEAIKQILSDQMGRKIEVYSVPE